jgi:hypothetical protein
MAEQERGHGNISDDLKVYREGIPLSFDDEINGRVEVDEDEGNVTLYVSDKEVAYALKAMVADGGFFYSANGFLTMEEVDAVKYEKEPDE